MEHLDPTNVTVKIRILYKKSPSNQVTYLIWLWWLAEPLLVVPVDDFSGDTLLDITGSSLLFWRAGVWGLEIVKAVVSTCGSCPVWLVSFSSSTISIVVVDWPSIITNEFTRASAAEDFLLGVFFMRRNLRLSRKLLGTLLLLFVFSTFSNICPFISRLLLMRFLAVLKIFQYRINIIRSGT